MNLPIGTKVKAKVDFPAVQVKKGMIGYVCENYEIGRWHKGATIIFENSAYDGFSTTEQEEYLENLGIDKRYEAYIYINIITVYDDWKRGYWDFTQEGNNES